MGVTMQRALERIKKRTERIKYLISNPQLLNDVNMDDLLINYDYSYKYDTSCELISAAAKQGNIIAKIAHAKHNKNIKELEQIGTKEALIVLRELYQETGNYEAEFKLCKEIYPHCAYRLGEIYEEKKMYPNAVKCYLIAMSQEDKPSRGLVSSFMRVLGEQTNYDYNKIQITIKQD